MKIIIYDIDKKEELIPKFLILIFWPATSCKSKEKVITSIGIAASKKNNTKTFNYCQGYKKTARNKKLAHYQQ